LLSVKIFVRLSGSPVVLWCQARISLERWVTVFTFGKTINRYIVDKFEVLVGSLILNLVQGAGLPAIYLMYFEFIYLCSVT